jgi:hypothetical protein
MPELGEWLIVIIIAVCVAASGMVLAWLVARSEMRRSLGGGPQNNSEEM